MPVNTPSISPDSCHEKRHYIVVVHGMGEQKANVTAPAVVERFAEARQRPPDGNVATKKSGKNEKASKSPDYNFIIPANLSEQTVRNNGYGHGWAEFDGIPVKKSAPSPGAPDFNGTIAAGANGHNFRFVDIDWQFILRNDIDTFGSSTEEWSSALLEKLERRKEQNDPMAPWALPMLRSIVNTAIPVKKMLAFKNAAITKLVFDGFLGDVHLYGDYGRTRGRAVRHFHVVLDEIMIRDFLQWYWNVYNQNSAQDNTPQKYEAPEFTIIAHSLGSIMSFDALVYAHIKDDIRKNDYTSDKWPASLPFPGYSFIHDIEKNNWDYLHQKLQDIWKKEQHNPEILKNIWELISPPNTPFDSYSDRAQLLESNKIPVPDIPYLSWRDHVTNFITIGSPIDKFLVLWPDNYLHLQNTSTLNPLFSGQIYHYNFCDEQDPVGHHLEEAMKTPLYQALFNTNPIGNHDVVLRRYGIPGLAHNLYWTDKYLFFGILDNIIDTKNGNSDNAFVWENIHEKKRAEISARRWAYYLIPFIATAITTALVSYALMNESLLWKWIYIIVSVLLWVQPNVLTAYKDEMSDSRKIARSWFAEKWNKFRPVRGIFSRLVSAAIEWRRILIVESLGSNTVDKKTKKYNISERIAFQSQEMISEPLKYFAQLIIISFAYLVLTFGLGFMLLEPAHIGKSPLDIFLTQPKNSHFSLTVTKIAFFFTLTNTMVRFYVSGSFLRAWIKTRNS